VLCYTLISDKESNEQRKYRETSGCLYLQKRDHPMQYIVREVIGGMMSAVSGREMHSCLIIFCLILLITPAVAGVEAPVVTGILPATGINSSTTAITDLAGTNFTTGAMVMLTPVTVNPTHKGSIINGGSTLLANPRDVYVSGNYAYVASTGSNALEIVDITNPAVPVHKGSIANGGSTLLSTPRGVYVSGNYAYVASTGSNALEIVDVTNPAVPVHAGSLSTGVGGALLTSPYSVYVSGNYAYVASYGSNALEIVDVTDPAVPAHKGSIGISTPSNVKVSGTYAYVTSTGGDALWIINVTNPAVPVPECSIAITAPSSVYVSGNFAYVGNTDYSGGALDIVNITNPAVPVHTGSIANYEGGARFSSPESVYVSGNYAYVVSPIINRLEIVDVTNPAVPVHTGSISNGGSALLLYPRSVFVAGNFAYVASFTSNALEIVDLGTVTATGVNVVSGKRITCLLNLNSRSDGSYNVVVTNPDGGFGTLLNGFTIFGADAPVADFYATPRSGTVPLTVTFTDWSTHSPTSWNWSFGDGNYSTLQSPVYTYRQGGVYTVSLTVTNAQGTGTLTRPDYIGVIFTANDGIAIFRNTTGFWYFDNNLDAIINSSFRYGVSTDRIIKGNWTGTGDGIAVYRPATGYWYFDYNLDGAVNKFFRFGNNGDQIIAGDWDGDGKDGIAVYRPATGYWYFDYNLDGVVNKSFRFGNKGDQIIAGDWLGTGRDGIAVYRPATGYWYFDYNLDGVVNKSFRFGNNGDQIIAGDWLGTGRDGIAVYRPAIGYWYLDYHATGIVDKAFQFGKSGDLPIAGKWRPDNPKRAPDSAFVANTLSGRSPLIVQFTDQSTGSPTSWRWSFGDGKTSTQQNPQHTYTSKKMTQSYTVILIVTNEFGSNTGVKTAYITAVKK
jgi:PKD repeat protein